MAIIKKVYNGIGAFSNRIYTRGVSVYQAPTSGDSESYDVTIKSVSGALVGNIRTDIQRPLISSIEFDIDIHGSNKFKFTLADAPPFPILPYSVITISLLGKSLYSGIIDYQDTLETEEALTYTGFGLRNYLNNLKVYDPTDPSVGQYSAGTDVGDIIDDISNNYIAPFSPIKYNATNITNPSGVAITHDIELSKYPITKILDIFSNMSGIRWYVDGRGEFVFKNNDKKLVLSLGYDFNKYKYTLDHKNVKNSIIVQRKQPKSAGGAGWVIGGIYNDDTSIHKYGKKEWTYQVPGYFSDADCDVIGANLLEDNKNPKPSGKLDNFKHLLYVEPYDLKIINQFALYEHEWDDCSNGWALDAGNTGDLAISYDTTYYVDSNSSLKLSYSTATGDKAYKDVQVIGKLDKFNFYARTNTETTVRVHITHSSGVETNDFFIPNVNSFVNIDYDFSSYNIWNVSKVEFEILSDGTNVEVFIDRIMTFLTAFKHEDLIYNKIKYVLKPDTMSMSIDAGSAPTNIENFLSALFAQADELNFTSEEI